MKNMLLRISNKLSNKQKKMISKIIHYATPFSKNLNLLALKYGTDKWSHGYIPRYHQYFKVLRKKS